VIICEIIVHLYVVIQNKYFLKRAKLVCAVTKAQLDESGGRLLLGDNIRGGAVMLWPIGFWCVPV
jgi:hypothetical protein